MSSHPKNVLLPSAPLLVLSTEYKNTHADVAHEQPQCADVGLKHTS